LKQKLKAVGPGLTPWQLLDQFKRILQVEVWFKLKAGGAIWLPRITQPEPARALLLHQLAWKLPEQPPPKDLQGSGLGCVADLRVPSAVVPKEIAFRSPNLRKSG
jgi:hypothetical protein